jgi:hypothetical protein
MNSQQPTFTDGDHILIRGGAGEHGIIAAAYSESWNVVYSPANDLSIHQKQVGFEGLQETIFIHLSDDCTSFPNTSDYDWILQVNQKDGSFFPSLIGGNKYNHSTKLLK